MLKQLQNKPTFDAAALREQIRDWKPAAAAGDDLQRVVIEWSTGTGPHCYVYVPGKRPGGIKLVGGGDHTGSDERWADFLEYEYVPQVADAVEAEGFAPHVICVDLRPLVIQRERRRTIAAAAHAKSGVAAH